MFNLILIIVMNLSPIKEKMLFDFEKENSAEWMIINDVVMGGVSSSNFIVQDGIARFYGKVSPENNGGFASVRGAVKINDIGDFKGIELKIKGDGKIYSLRFRTDNNFDGISYQAKFISENNKWSVLKIPFREFIPTFRGRSVKGKPPLLSSNIQQVGLLIADKQFGSFDLQIDYLKLYKD